MAGKILERLSLAAPVMRPVKSWLHRSSTIQRAGEFEQHVINGTTVLINSSPMLLSQRVGALVGVGSQHGLIKGYPGGIAHVTEHAVMAASVNRRGSLPLGATTYDFQTYYHAQKPGNYFAKEFFTFTGRLFHSLGAPWDIRRIEPLLRNEINCVKIEVGDTSNNEFRKDMNIRGLAQVDTPALREALIPYDSLDGITPELVVSFMRRFYNKNNAVIALSSPRSVKTLSQLCANALFLPDGQKNTTNHVAFVGDRVVCHSPEQRNSSVSMTFYYDARDCSLFQDVSLAVARNAFFNFSDEFKAFMRERGLIYSLHSSADTDWKLQSPNGEYVSFITLRDPVPAISALAESFWQSLDQLGKDKSLADTIKRATAMQLLETRRVSETVRHFHLTGQLPPRAPQIYDAVMDVDMRDVRRHLAGLVRSPFAINIETSSRDVPSYNEIRHIVGYARAERKPTGPLLLPAPRPY